jgi:small subunit ribosomal protein S20
MPNKRNAKKALRQNIKRAKLNKTRRDAYKNAIKKVLKSETKDKKESLRLAQKALDKAAKRGVIKKNTAARKLSRLMKKANKK